MILSREQDSAFATPPYGPGCIHFLQFDVIDSDLQQSKLLSHEIRSAGYERFSSVGASFDSSLPIHPKETSK